MPIPSTQIVAFAADMRKVVPAAPTTPEREARNLRELSERQKAMAEPLPEENYPEWYAVYRWGV